ncbi:MAG: hypothetical protein ABIP94_00295 [Planctomycetota bacterium]
MKMTTSACVLCILLSPGVAQRPGRILLPTTNGGVHSNFLSARIEEPVGGWSFTIDDDGAFASYWVDPPNGDFLEGALQLAVVVPGDYCVIPGPAYASPHVLLVVGRDAQGLGVVQSIRVDAATMQVSSLAVRTFPNRDFVGVAYDRYAGRIALLDLLAQQVVDGPWVVGGPLPDASQLTAWDTSGFPPSVMSGLTKKYLVFLDVGEGSPPSVGQYYIGPERDPYSSGYFLLNAGGQPAVAYPGTWYSSPTSYEPWARSDNEGATSVLVQGGPGSAVEVVHFDTGQVLGSVMVPSTGWTLASSTPCLLVQPLAIGETYAIRRAGDAIGNHTTRILCVARHGVPGESVPSGLTFGSVDAPIHGYLGNPEYTVRAHVSGGPQIPGGYFTGATAFLSALRGPGGVDLLLPNPWGGNPLLAPVLSGWLSTFVRSNGSADVTWVFPLPVDPSLVGEVLLTQFLLVEPGNGPLGLSVATSEAVGARLHLRAP